MKFEKSQIVDVAVNVSRLTSDEIANFNAEFGGQIEGSSDEIANIDAEFGG